MRCVQHVLCTIYDICFCMMQSCFACCIPPNTMEILGPETNQGMCMWSGAMPQLWGMKSCTSPRGCSTPLGTPLWVQALHLGSCLHRHPLFRSVIEFGPVALCLFYQRRTACFSLDSGSVCILCSLPTCAICTDFYWLLPPTFSPTWHAKKHCIRCLCCSHNHYQVCGCTKI